MDKQQKIVEMAKDICRYQPCCNDVCKPISACDALRYAERAVEAGHVKQSEGEWIDRYNGKYANPIYVCSLCGRGTLLKPNINELGNMEMIQALSSFCPNCGAKMKGGK